MGDVRLSFQLKMAVLVLKWSESMFPTLMENISRVLHSILISTMMVLNVMEILVIAHQNKKKCLKHVQIQ